MERLLAYVNSLWTTVLILILCVVTVFKAVTQEMSHIKQQQKKKTTTATTAFPIWSSKKTIQTTGILLSSAAGIIYWYEVYTLIFYVLIAAGISLFFPYLKKPSRYIAYCLNGQCDRVWSDKLIYTSLVYLLGTIAALYHAQFALAFVSTITSIGSILYHKHREGQFFNFDNVFATSHVMMFGYAVFDAWQNNEWTFFTFTVCAAPIAVFLLIYCGDPAEVTKDTVPIVRYSRKLYDDYHTLWHFASGFGPVLVSFYFVGQEFNTLIYVSVAISLFINLSANYCAAVPFD